MGLHANQYPCTLCAEHFTTKPAQADHLSTAHGSDQPWLCHECPTAFESEEGLDEHTGASHRAAKIQLHCPLVGCRLPLASEAMQLRHKKHDHSEQTTRRWDGLPRGCIKKNCDYVNESYVGMSLHMLHQHAFTCTGCKEKFLKGGELLDHRKDCLDVQILEALKEEFASEGTTTTMTRHESKTRFHGVKVALVPTSAETIAAPVATKKGEGEATLPSKPTSQLKTVSLAKYTAQLKSKSRPKPSLKRSFEEEEDATSEEPPSSKRTKVGAGSPTAPPTAAARTLQQQSNSKAVGSVSQDSPKCDPPTQDSEYRPKSPQLGGLDTQPAFTDNGYQGSNAASRPTITQQRPSIDHDAFIAAQFGGDVGPPEAYKLTPAQQDGYRPAAPKATSRTSQAATKAQKVDYIDLTEDADSSSPAANGAPHQPQGGSVVSASAPSQARYDSAAQRPSSSDGSHAAAATIQPSLLQEGPHYGSPPSSQLHQAHATAASSQQAIQENGYYPRSALGIGAGPKSNPYDHTSNYLSDEMSFDEVVGRIEGVSDDLFGVQDSRAAAAPANVPQTQMQSPTGQANLHSAAFNAAPIFPYGGAIQADATEIAPQSGMLLPQSVYARGYTDDDFNPTTVWESTVPNKHNYREFPPELDDAYIFNANPRHIAYSNILRLAKKYSNAEICRLVNEGRPKPVFNSTQVVESRVASAVKWVAQNYNYPGGVDQVKAELDRERAKNGVSFRAGKKRGREEEFTPPVDPALTQVATTPHKRVKTAYSVSSPPTAPERPDPHGLRGSIYYQHVRNNNANQYLPQGQGHFPVSPTVPDGNGSEYEGLDGFDDVTREQVAASRRAKEGKGGDGGSRM